MKIKLIALFMLSSILLIACEADGLEANTSLLTDDLTKVLIVGGNLEIHTKTEQIIFDESRDEIVQRGDKYKLMKMSKEGNDVAYILQVPKEEYTKFEEYYNTKVLN